MKIRSITSFLNPEYPLNQEKLKQAGEFNQQAQDAYTEAGYEIQTTRIATIPFPWLFKGLEGKDLIAAVQEDSDHAVAAVERRARSVEDGALRGHAATHGQRAGPGRVDSRGRALARAPFETFGLSAEDLDPGRVEAAAVVVAVDENVTCSRRGAWLPHSGPG